MTTTPNYNRHLHGIPFDTMPTTFRDAVLATRRLGFLPLIDSLCIIQGDCGDWAHECSKMAEVYEHCALAIAASSANNADDGFLHARKTTVLAQCKFPDDDPPEQLTLAIPDFEDERKWGDFLYPSYGLPDNLPRLITRGWVLQERLLSPRAVHFGSREMSFECKRTAFHESRWWPSGQILKLGSTSKRDICLDGANIRKPDLHRMWLDIATSYSYLKLSQGIDKLQLSLGLRRDSVVRLKMATLPVS
jgi:hypothetical protein